MRQRESGESRWSATVSLPDICAQVVKIALRINSLCGSGVFRIIDLARAVKGWRQATALKYASSSRTWEALDFAGRVMDDMRNRREKMHCGLTPLAGWSDAAAGDQSTGGKCRLGRVFCLMSSSLTSPRHIL